VSGTVGSLRQLALYLLCTAAAVSAEAAWGRTGPAGLFSHVLLLAVALVIGDLLEDVLSGLATSVWRWRARVVGLSACALAGFFVLLAAISSAPLAARAAHACALAQSLLLVLAGALGLQAAVLGNALLLVVLAALAGGEAAAIGTTGFVAALSFFFAFDHAARRLQSRPASASLVRRLTVDAARQTAPAVLLVAFLFTLALPTRPAGLADLTEIDRAGVPHVFEWLFLLTVIVSGALLGVSRMFRSDSPPDVLLEDVLTHVEAEEMLDRPAVDASTYAGARERVIRAYLGVLSRARDAGCELPPHLTPREIEGRVREGAAMRDLTAVFADARYGPGEPDATAVATAVSSANAVDAALGRRRRPRRASRPARQFEP
jgi:hypothetical protein